MPRVPTVVFALRESKFGKKVLFWGSDVWFQLELATIVGSRSGSAGPVDNGIEPMMERSVRVPGPVRLLSEGALPPVKGKAPLASMLPAASGGPTPGGPS